MSRNESDRNLHFNFQEAISSRAYLEQRSDTDCATLDKQTRSNNRRVVAAGANRMLDRIALELDRRGVNFNFTF